ncbi:MAG: hypothetical protein ABIJ96_06745 [Elusimicrobiota bacterium]
MAHHLEAFVAERAQLEHMALKLPSAKVVDLAADLCLLPVTAAVKADITGSDEPAFAGLDLSEKLAQLAQECSRAGAIAYIEAHYLKGRDHQASAFWSQNKMTLEPSIEDTPWDPRESNDTRPVNKVLRILGLKPGSFDDEWDAAGLTRHNATENWAK